MSFFKIYNNRLFLDEEYILMNKPFADILEKYGKTTANKYFRYIYEIADNRSHSNKNALSAKEAHEHACNIVNFDAKSFKPDTMLTKAIAYYKKHNYNLHADTLKDLKTSLDKVKKINTKINQTIDRSLDKEEELDSTEISNLINLESKLFSLIDELPNKVQSIKKLEHLVFKELEKEKELARGGTPIPSSYEGDPEIEGT